VQRTGVTSSLRQATCSICGEEFAEQLMMRLPNFVELPLQRRDLVCPSCHEGFLETMGRPGSDLPIWEAWQR
jgi:hypothetical protein